MRVIVSPQAEKQLIKINKVYQIAIGRKIRKLSDNSTTSQEKKLSGLKNIFRVRVGDCRVVYKRSVTQIYIILTSHTKDVYDLVKKVTR